MSRRPTRTSDRLRLRFGDWGFVDHLPGGVFGPLRLQDYDLIWMIEGTMTLDTGDLRQVLPAPSLCLLRPGMLVRLQWDQVHSCRQFFLHVELPRLPAGLPPPAAWPAARALASDDLMRPLLAHLAGLLAIPGADHRQAATAFELVLRAFVSGRCDAGAPEAVRLGPMSERLVACLARRWSPQSYRPLTLAAVAKDVGVGSEHLCRRIRSELGLAPMEVIRLMRLEHAGNLLTRSGDSIGSIARLVGFADPFHFSRTFRAAFGCSPRTFRRQGLAGADRPVIGSTAFHSFRRRIWEELG